MAIFSFIEAKLDVLQLRIGVRDRTLKLGCSYIFQDILVHTIDIDLLFYIFLY